MQKITIPIGVDLANFRPVNTFVSMEKLAGKETVCVTKDPKIEEEVTYLEEPYVPHGIVGHG